MGEIYVGRKFRTDFVEGGKPNESIVSEIISVGKKLNDLGLTPENAGNISVRTENGMLITVGGKNKGELTPDDLTEVIDFDGELAKAVGTNEPSSETPMHWLAYEKRPDVEAIIHVHDDAILEKAEELGLPETRETRYGTEEQAEMTVGLLGKNDYVAIKNHGIVAVGKNLSEVYNLVVVMHEKALE
ncbi:MAG TPA: class II aldolase/adducin family protein [Candidatus Altiarchaeales archaeon]|nr:class II aldolase/adducin family protein [Candidatus Altiarchaeales archaeon]